MQDCKNRARGQHQYPIAASAPHVYETPRVTVETCGNQGNDHSDGDGNRKPDQYKADILAPAFEIELFFQRADDNQSRQGKQHANRKHDGSHRAV